MQGTDQRAYDRGHTIFSPDGRLYQVEYAREAVGRGSATVGVRTDDAVVLASAVRARSPLLVAESIQKLHDVDGQVGVATAGHVADGRRLVEWGREYAQRERLSFGEPPGVEPLATAIADFVQESTQSGGTRPFGAALLVGGVADAGPRLFEIDPSGTPNEWHATALGGDSDAILALFEDEYSRPLDAASGVSLALRGLDAGAEDDLTAPELDVALLDAEGIDAFDRDRRETALAEAGIGSAAS